MHGRFEGSRLTGAALRACACVRACVLVCGSPPQAVQNNGSLWLHAVFARAGSSINPDDPDFVEDHVFGRAFSERLEWCWLSQRPGSCHALRVGVGQQGGQQEENTRCVFTPCVRADMVAYLPKPKNDTGVNLLSGEKQAAKPKVEDPKVRDGGRHDGWGATQRPGGSAWERHEYTQGVRVGDCLAPRRGVLTEVGLVACACAAWAGRGAPGDCELPQAQPDHPARRPLQHLPQERHPAAGACSAGKPGQRWARLGAQAWTAGLQAQLWEATAMRSGPWLGRQTAAQAVAACGGAIQTRCGGAAHVLHLLRAPPRRWAHVAGSMQFDGEGNYFPIIFFNEFWLLRDYLVPLNETVTNVTLSLDYGLVSMTW